MRPHFLGARPKPAGVSAFWVRPRRAYTVPSWWRTELLTVDEFLAAMRRLTELLGDDCDWRAPGWSIR